MYVCLCEDFVFWRSLAGSASLMPGPFELLLFFSLMVRDELLKVVELI